MIRRSMILGSAAFLAVSCNQQQKIQTEKNDGSAPQAEARVDRKLHVEVPVGLVTVTDRQSRLVAGLKDLSEGMSQPEVKARLGEPSEERPETLFYNCVEDRHQGGHYVTATLSFGRDGLASAKVDYGHVTLEPRTAR